MSGQDFNDEISPIDPPDRPKRAAYPDPDESLATTQPLHEPETEEQPQRGYTEPPPAVEGGEEEPDPSRRPLILGIVILLALAAVITYLVFRDRDADTAEPVPPPTQTVTTSAAPPPASPTADATETAEATQPTAETTPSEEPAAPETTSEATPTSEATAETTAPEPAGDPAPLTAADLPGTVGGWTFNSEIAEDLVYGRDGDFILLSALGIWEMDPAWQEMTFPGAQPLGDNVSCSADEGAGQGCFIMSSAFGVVTASGDPGVDISEFVTELAGHLR